MLSLMPSTQSRWNAVIFDLDGTLIDSESVAGDVLCTYLREHGFFEAAKQAEEIIDVEVAHFLNWMRAQGATDTIRELRFHADSIREAALERALRGLRAGQSPEESLTYLSQLLTHKFTLLPSTQQIGRAHV